MTEQEKQGLGITPEMEAFGTFNVQPPTYGEQDNSRQEEKVEAPHPTVPPTDGAQPKNDTEQKQEDTSKQETEKEPERAEGAKGKTNVDYDALRRSRVKARANELKEKRVAILEKYKQAEGKEDLQTFYAEQDEAHEAELMRINKELQEDYTLNLRKSIGDEHFEYAIELLDDYAPLIAKDEWFKKWFMDHPKHFEVIYPLCDVFASGQSITIEQFNNMPFSQKKCFIDNFIYALENPPKEEEAAEPLKPATSNGKPLPTVEVASTAGMPGADSSTKEWFDHLMNK
jgi:hypothetical protein